MFGGVTAGIKEGNKAALNCLSRLKCEGVTVSPRGVAIWGLSQLIALIQLVLIQDKMGALARSGSISSFVR